MILLEILAYILFFYLGFFLFQFALKKYLILTNLKKKGEATTAEVVGLKQDNLAYTPIISFSDYRNVQITGVPRNSIPVVYFSFHKIGDKVKVFYNSQDSSDFAIDELSDKVSVLFFGLAGTSFLFAVVHDVVKRILQL